MIRKIHFGLFLLLAVFSTSSWSGFSIHTYTGVGQIYSTCEILVLNTIHWTNFINPIAITLDINSFDAAQIVKQSYSSQNGSFFSNHISPFIQMIQNMRNADSPLDVFTYGSNTSSHSLSEYLRSKVVLEIENLSNNEKSDLFHIRGMLSKIEQKNSDLVFTFESDSKSSGDWLRVFTPNSLSLDSESIEKIEVVLSSSGLLLLDIHQAQATHIQPFTGHLLSLNLKKIKSP